jgi:hypothetical protein
MTDNTKFKEDATQLLNKLISFQRSYIQNNSRVRETSAKSFENDLRMMLMVARTDEENQEQRKVDSYC